MYTFLQVAVCKQIIELEIGLCWGLLGSMPRLVDLLVLVR